MSKFVSHGTNLIVAGKTVNGREYGGTYYPAGQKPGGNPYPARWTGNFFVNSRNRDAEAMVIKVTAWNSKSAKEGKGRADLFARNLSRGKCMHLDLEPQVHEQKRYAQDGNGGSRLVVDGQGNPIMDKVTTYRVLDFEFGNDSANQTAKEMMAFDATNPQMDVFNRRPLNYNGAMAENDPRYAQHAGDVELWKTVQNIRKSAVYVPGNS
ncbi:MAG: hypothetical protein GY845_16750, partial [Planctomycetes bacterium]|nr:hypothetical protein [Planctomycetota bacterium]